jgi:hypothetical protein
MIVKKDLTKITDGIQAMLIDTKVNMPYYGEFNLHISFVESESIGTCANVTQRYELFSPKFLEDLSQRSKLHHFT